MDKPKIIEHVHKPLDFTLFDARWIPSSARFVVLGNHARGTGALQIYEISKGSVNLVKNVSAMQRTSCYHIYLAVIFCLPYFGLVQFWKTYLELLSVDSCDTQGVTNIPVDKIPHNPGITRHLPYS